MGDYNKLVALFRAFGEDCADPDCCRDCQFSGFCESGFTPGEIADAIEELLQKTQQPEWISVEERLPENFRTVLCWYEYYHVSKNKVLPEYEIGYIFNGRWCGEVAVGRDCKVLYWMPLPEPPKEGAE